MAGNCADPLVLDLVEWIAREPRLYSEVIDDLAHLVPAADDLGGRGRSRLCRARGGCGLGAVIAITPDGEQFLRAHGRVGLIRRRWQNFI